MNNVSYLRQRTQFGCRLCERSGAHISPGLLIVELEMSAMQTISVQVIPEAAKAYRKASVTKRKKMELLLSMRLLKATSSHKSPETVMSEISRSCEGTRPDARNPRRTAQIGLSSD